VSAPTFLERLTPSERGDLEAHGRTRTLHRGAVLFHEGDDAHEVLVLLSGQVKVARAAATGRDVILCVFDTGEVLGELSAVDGAPRSATAVALCTVVALMVPLSEFNAFLERRPRVANELLRTVVERLRGSSQRQLEFGTADALTRLCRCLVDMADRYGADEDGCRSVRLPLAQHELAALAGLSREAVVKGLQSLRALGWIRATGRSVSLVDEDSLRARAAI
jgi:CRP/FNR family transcriptional regulator, cyclic AMP receptor protein